MEQSIFAGPLLTLSLKVPAVWFARSVRSVSGSGATCDMLQIVCFSGNKRAQVVGISSGMRRSDKAGEACRGWVPCEMGSANAHMRIQILTTLVVS